MRIYRAHSYHSIEIIREEEKKLNSRILTMIQPYVLIVLPPSLDFDFVGLKVGFTKQEQAKYSGWCHSPRSLKFSHIFIKEGYEKWAFIHEVGHALDERLGHPSEKFFRPELALTDYGMTNPHEYFAEAFMQFFDPVEKEELFKADKNIFYFIRKITKGARYNGRWK